MIGNLGAVKPRVRRRDNFEILCQLIGKWLVYNGPATAMQQQKRGAGPLARHLNLDTLQCVFFYFFRHDDASAALLFKTIHFLKFSYHSAGSASNRCT